MRDVPRVTPILRRVRQRVLLLIRILTVRLAYGVAKILPIRRRVVLATAHTSAIRGNLAAIRAELVRRNLSIPIVTLIHPSEAGLVARLRGVARDAQAAYYLATSSLFIVDSHYLPIYLITRRAGTSIVQTWHAIGAIKKIGYSVLDKEFGANATTVSLVPIHTNYDLCLAGSAAAVEQYVDAFRQPPELFVTELGIPRTDVLTDLTRGARLAAEVRRRYALPTDRRLILYAPTFRGRSMTRAQHPEDLDLGVLARHLGKDHVLMLRLHPSVRGKAEVGPEMAGFAIDVSDYPEVNELMLVADILVTDYSSVVFEFALLGRPMAFFAPDHDAYDNERGYYFDYRSTMPGPVFETTEALAAYLRAGEFDLERVRDFARTWNDVCDGRASERFVDHVVLPALAGESVRAAAAS
jgi:teichoic acid ribitol-phosphate primase